MVAKTESKIIDGASLPEYFMEKVQKAILNQNVELTKDAEFYLVSLLTEFKKVDALFILRDGSMEEEPLALRLARALSGDVAMRVHELKKLGDVSLYIAGFFEEHLERSLVDVGYYIDMGSSAYGSLAGTLSYQKTFADLYLELSEKFAKLAAILEEVSTSENATDLDILKLYERWLKSGDEKIREVLIKEGVFPTKKIFC